MSTPGAGRRRDAVPPRGPPVAFVTVTLFVALTASAAALPAGVVKGWGGNWAGQLDVPDGAAVAVATGGCMVVTRGCVQLARCREDSVHERGRAWLLLVPQVHLFTFFTRGGR